MCEKETVKHLGDKIGYPTTGVFIPALACDVKQEGYQPTDKLDTSNTPRLNDIGSGIDLIAKERKRQIDVKGWTSSHDGNHDNGELAKAAACYCLAEDLRDSDKNRSALVIVRWWPFATEWWKPTPSDRIKELVKAGALIAAEIDRLQTLNP